MTKKKATNQSEVIEGELIAAEPTPHQIKLVTVLDCKREMAKVYRDSRQGRIDIHAARGWFTCYLKSAN